MDALRFFHCGSVPVMSDALEYEASSSTANDWLTFFQILSRHLLVLRMIEVMKQSSSCLHSAQVEELGIQSSSQITLQAMSRSRIRAAAKCTATPPDGVLKALLSLPTTPTQACLRSTEQHFCRRWLGQCVLDT